jgi:hypothetical protein
MSTSGGEIANQVVYVLSSLLVSISITVSIFARYAWFQHFPISAILNIGVAFVLSFFQIGLAATDLAFTKRARAQYGENGQDSEEHRVLRNFMSALWFIVYWGTIVTGSILMQFLKRYWTCGQFSVGSKVKFVLKKMFVQILAMVAVFSTLSGFLIFYMKKDAKNLMKSLNTAVLIYSNIYAMSILVILLAHGLFKLPISLWKYKDNRYNLLNALSRADTVRRAYRTSLIEYHEQISICKTLEEQHATGYNRRFFDILMNEIPDHDLDGQKISHLKSIGGLEVKNGKVDENLIAQVRYQHKLAFFNYLRKKSRW